VAGSCLGISCRVATASPEDSRATQPEPISPAARPRVAVDLLSNRIHASAHREGHLIVEAGSLDFLKYVDGGWKTSWILGEKDTGTPAALVSGLSAQLFLPVDVDADEGGDKEVAGGSAPGNTTLAFTARALAPRQKLSIFFNEKAVGTVDLETGSQKRYQVPVPAAAVKYGENRVRLTFRAAGGIAGGRHSAAAFTDLTLGPAAADGGAAPPAPIGARVGPATLGGVRKTEISIDGKSSRLSYYVAVPEGAVLELAHGSDVPAARAIVRVSVDGQVTRQLLDAATSSGRWAEVSLPLGAAGGQAARIDLISRGGSVKWAEPRLVVRESSPAAAPAARRFDHVFVWMVDTLRADKVHVYNPSTRVQTPNYDAFAADATRFEWAQVPGTWSLPSHASLLTGVYPPVHQAISADAKLSEDVAFIAEDMHKRGFKTAIFSSNGYVSTKWGFGRGWDVYRNFIRENLPNGADYLWRTAKHWVLQNRQKPEFVYLATVDPHVAYTPKPQFLKKYWNKPYHGPLRPALTGVQLGAIGAGKLKINDEDKAYLEALHDGEITQSDSSFATFLADLKAADLYERSVVIVVSDHGDEFGEHGRFGHGQSVYQELTHVPLLIRAPGRMPQGKVVHADVEIMDLYTTLLDLVGAPVGEHIQGSSLIQLSWDEVGQVGPGMSPRAAFTIDGQSARGVKVERYRLVAMSGRLELYDEREDRLEQKDVAATRPIALRFMRGVMGILHPYETSWNKSRWGTAANVTAAFTADIEPERNREPGP